MVDTKPEFSKVVFGECVDCGARWAVQRRHVKRRCSLCNVKQIRLHQNKCNQLEKNRRESAKAKIEALEINQAKLLQINGRLERIIANRDQAIRDCNYVLDEKDKAIDELVENGIEVLRSREQCRFRISELESITRFKPWGKSR